MGNVEWHARFHDKKCLLHARVGEGKGQSRVGSVAKSMRENEERPEEGLVSCVAVGEQGWPFHAFVWTLGARCRRKIVGHGKDGEWAGIDVAGVADSVFIFMLGSVFGNVVLDAGEV